MYLQPSLKRPAAVGRGLEAGEAHGRWSAQDPETRFPCAWHPGDAQETGISASGATTRGGRER